MKKTVKFTGTMESESAYFTAVLFPKKKENLKIYAQFIRSILPVNEERQRVDVSECSVEFVANIDLLDEKILIRVLYYSTHWTTNFEKEDLRVAENHGSRIVEQAEVLIDALEEE